MAKKVKKVNKVVKSDKSTGLLRVADIGGIASGIWFTSSVMINVYDLATSGTLNTPASYLLYLGLACVLYTVAIRRKLDTLNSFVLGLLSSSTAIWLFGLTSIS